MKYTFAKPFADTTILSSGNIFRKKIQLTNNEKDTIFVRTDIQSSLTPLAVPPNKIILAPHETKTVFISMYVARKLSATSVYPVMFIAENIYTRQLLLKEKYFIQIVPNHNINISVPNNHLYFTAENDFYNIPISCSNRSNVSEKIILSIRNNDSVIVSNQYEINLKEFTDTSLMLPVMLKQKNKTFNESNIVVESRSADNQLISANLVTAHYLSSKYDLAHNTDMSGLSSHTLGLQMNNIGQSFSNYQLYLDGQQKINNININYRLNTLFYPERNNKLLNIYNSYLELENKKLKIKGGNLFLSDELFMSGIGIRAEGKVSNRATVTTGFLDDKYNITLGGRMNNERSKSVFYFMYDEIYNAATKVKILANVIKNYQQNENNYLFGGYCLHKIRPNQTLKFGQFVSFDQPKEKDTLKSLKLNGASSIAYNGTFKKIDLSLSITSKSPSYAGFNHGLTSLEEAIIYRKNATTTYWLKHSKQLFSFLPNRYTSFSTKSVSEQIDAGYTKLLNSQYSLLLKPGYLYEEMRSPYFAENTLQWIKGPGLTASLQYTGKFFGDVHLETGWKSSSSSTYRNYIHGRLQMGIHYNNFAAQFVLKIAPASINDIRAVYYSNNKLLSLQFNVSKMASFFKNQLQLHLSNSAYYDNIYQQFVNTTSIQTLWTLTPQLNANFNYSRHQYTYSRSEHIVSAGFTKKLFTYPANINPSFELVAYHDSNNNNTFDKQEATVSDAIIKIGGTIFNTDKNGKIIYKHIPPGNYKIEVLEAGQLYSNALNVYINKSQKILIPFNHHYSVNGKIILPNATNLTDLSKIEITAISKNGIISKTYTNMQGEFQFNLSEDTYTITINKLTIPKDYYTNEYSEKISVASNTVNYLKIPLMVMEKNKHIKSFPSRL